MAIVKIKQEKGGFSDQNLLDNCFFKERRLTCGAISN